MTLSHPRRRTRNFLVIALILSALIHLIGGGLWGLFARVLARFVPKPVFMASLQETPAPHAEIIRLERPAKAVARQAHENRVTTVAPRPHPVVTTAPSIPHPRHEIARIRIHAPAQPAPAHAKSVALQTPRRIIAVAPAAVPDRKPALSDRQLAQLGQDFSKTIAESRETLAGVQAESEHASVTTIKQYTVPFSGIHEGMNPGDGIIRPVKHWRGADGQDYYYVHYEYMYGDGHVEEADVPWPVHYPPNDDPFVRGDKRIPIQDPPPGFQPSGQLQPILQAFFGGPNPFAQEQKDQ